ncbi:DUF1614 domain-containing protein [Dethiobacter alkaliphilus]|uniref:DUF1614 domain-containing protein n=1 Tax=Dethiobacter alkaliphilus TaxID=427926 RepID=UPI0022266B21|nr:DUF1614 domain-containing protein [Dethiobacter alkaliphilus]MCW3491501.1 DUF1614 domain-containing protein [Dethiobacter alkaliphilus]
MTIGMIVLVVVAVLVYLGAAQRVLDRLRLTDRAALLFLGAMVVGGFLPDIPITDNVSINIGGGIIPIVLAVYLFIKAGSTKEKVRAVLAALVTGGVVYAAMKIMPSEPTYNYFLDPMYLFAIIAAVVGYLAGRSRRSAFIAGSMGILLTDIFSRIEIAIYGGSGSMSIGGAGVFDAIVISGILALLLAEIFGESRERIQGGPSQDRPDSLKKGLSDVELSEELDREEMQKNEEEEEYKHEE